MTTGFNITVQEFVEARTIMRQFSAETWPEDEWFSLSQSADLNLYLEEGAPKAAIYYVDRQGRTQTDIYTRIDTPFDKVKEETPEERRAILEKTARPGLESLCKLYYPGYRASVATEAEMIEDILEAERKQKEQPYSLP